VRACKDDTSLRVPKQLQAEFETIAYDAKLREDERTEHDSIEKWRLLRHLSRLDLKAFSHTVLERDSSLLFAACEMFRAVDPAAEVTHPLPTASQFYLKERFLQL
jgi:hypothetical protein